MNYLFLKRLFDIFFSLFVLVLFSPFALVIIILIKLDSQGPIFFTQKRIGRNMKSFKVFKFRTMVHTTDCKGPYITSANDPRITKFGRFLRKYKLDEWPQFINVIRGDMSVVGPRPEIEKYVKIFREEFKKILVVRPGITGMASLEHFDEEIRLEKQKDKERFYVEEILPKKLWYEQMYVQNVSLYLDLKIMTRTIVRILSGMRMNRESKHGCKKCA